MLLSLTACSTVNDLPGQKAKATSTTVPATSTTRSSSPTIETSAAGGLPTVPLTGTGYSIPTPLPDIGTELHTVTFDSDPAPGVALSGWHWDRLDPATNAKASGVSVVFVSNPNSRSGDIAAIADDANHEHPDYETSVIHGLTLISWPASDEKVSETGGTPRHVDRYVIVLDDGRLDVAFEAVKDQHSREGYLMALAEAVTR